MNIVRLDPFREMAVLQDRVNRVFGDLGRRFDDDVAARGAWVPAVDIFENDQHELVFKAELPDLQREDIDIRVENNTLTLSGQKKAEQEFSEDRYHRIERTFGHFSLYVHAAEHCRYRPDLGGVQERRPDRETAEARRRQAEADPGPDQLATISRLTAARR